MKFVLVLVTKTSESCFVTSVTGVHCTICWHWKNMRSIAKGWIEVLALTGLTGIFRRVLRLYGP